MTSPATLAALLIALALTILAPTNATAQQSVLRLGTESGINLNLIRPVTLNDHTTDTTDDKLYYYLDQNNSRSASGGDNITHRQLNNLLNGGVDTTDALATRSVIIGAYTLVLPTLAEMRALRADQSNSHPPGWLTFIYHTATRSSAGRHTGISLTGGGEANFSTMLGLNAAFQVIVTPAAPAAPTDVTLTASNTRLTVSWTPVLDRNNGGAEITAYTATAEATGQDTRTCTTPGTATATQPNNTCTITDLTNDVEYSVTVVATNSDDNNSVNSTEATATIPAELSFRIKVFLEGAQ